MSIKRDNTAIANLYMESTAPGQDPIDSEVGDYETHGRPAAVPEDAETPAQLERVEKGTIFFDDSLEIYKATMKGEHPEYTFMGNVNPKLQHKFRGWRDAHIATGEDIAEVGYSDAVDHSAWYIVGNDFPQDNSFKVRIK